MNRPYKDPNMRFYAAIDFRKCSGIYKDGFVIKYRIYGDWAETQGSELKVILKENQEVT